MVNNGEQKHVRDQGSGHVRDCNTRVNLELFKMLLEEFENLDGMQCDRLLKHTCTLIKYTCTRIKVKTSELHKPHAHSHANTHS